MTTTVTPERLRVLAGPLMGDQPTISGSMNITDDQVQANIASAIRRGLPQMAPGPPTPDLCLLVGGGPSLAQTVDTLRDQVFAGASVVALNGSAAWLLERNIRPQAHIIMDGRASNARFVETPIPRCKYFIASQAHPDVFDALTGRPDVFVFHAVTGQGGQAELLNAYYGTGHWMPVAGGTTVASRALSLMRLGGFHRFGLFGIDSCWAGDAHHAFPQAENNDDRRVAVTASPTGHPDLARTFVCSPWHVKQLEDMLQFIRINGHTFVVQVHGDGLIAHALSAMAAAGDVEIDTQEAT